VQADGSRRLLLATHNEHKRREFGRLLAAEQGARGWEVGVLPASVALPPELGVTFAQNAIAKAVALKHAGDTLDLTIWRDGRSMNVKVTLAEQGDGVL